MLAAAAKNRSAIVLATDTHLLLFPSLVWLRVAVAAAEKILRERVTGEAANALAEQSIRALKGQLN